jgi:Lon-like protease
MIMRPKDRDEIMTKQMETSKIKSKVAAFRAMGYDVSVKRSPVEITAVASESKAAKVLERGDIILSLDGVPVDREEQVIEKSKDFDDEESVRMTIRRDDREMELMVPLTILSGKKRIGILISSEITEVDLPRIVEIESHNIIGSSAGLIFTLEIINQVSGANLPDNYLIAGTGAIDENGKIYPISSTGLKVIAAEKENAAIFLVPEANYNEAVEKATSIKVYPVRDLEDALKTLKEINPSISLDEISQDFDKTGN